MTTSKRFFRLAMFAAFVSITGCARPPSVETAPNNLDSSGAEGQYPVLTIDQTLREALNRAVRATSKDGLDLPVGGVETCSTATWRPSVCRSPKRAAHASSLKEISVTLNQDMIAYLHVCTAKPLRRGMAPKHPDPSYDPAILTAPIDATVRVLLYSRTSGEIRELYQRNITDRAALCGPTTLTTSSDNRFFVVTIGETSYQVRIPTEGTDR